MNTLVFLFLNIAIAAIVWAAYRIGFKRGCEQQRGTPQAGADGTVRAQRTGGSTGRSG